MTDRDSPLPPKPPRDRAPQRGGAREKRPRTVYLLQRRYQLLSRLVAVIGAAVGLALVAYSLWPSIIAGDRVPLASFLVGAAIIAALAIIPHVLVRWRWRVVKASLDED